MHLLSVRSDMRPTPRHGHEVQKRQHVRRAWNAYFRRCFVCQRRFLWAATHIFLSFGIVGCAGGLFSEDRLSTALQIGTKRDMSMHWLTRGQFTLLTQISVRKSGAPLRVYIEGDGFAWITRTRPSPDPTPRIPLALYLAEQDIVTSTTPNIAWIARPCQYIMLSNPKRRCAQKYWTSSRLAPEIIEALDAVISDLKRKARAPVVELVGYSGGGGAAVLVAARRSDVVHIRTVAGNIDTDVFVRHHRVSPMRGSQNPLLAASKITHIPQLHFIGAEDDIVPPAISDTFIKQAGGAARRIIVPDLGHGQDWIDEWPRLLQASMPPP